MNFSLYHRPESNVPLAYEIRGNGSPLVFIHGLGAGRAQTTSALTGLSDRMLIAPDMLGHGDSISCDPSVEMGFNQFADDVISLLDHLGIEKCDVGGLSMGSGIALNLALRHPERVAKLILLRPSWLSQPQPAHLALVANVGNWLQAYGAEKAESMLISHPDYIALNEIAPRVADSICALFTRPDHVSHTCVLSMMWNDAPFLSLDDLSNVQQDALVLYTTRDHLHPVSVAQTIAARLPKLHCIQELPPRYDQPELYTNALNQALNDFHHWEA